MFISVVTVIFHIQMDSFDDSNKLLIPISCFCIMLTAVSQMLFWEIDDNCARIREKFYPLNITPII